MPTASKFFAGVALALVCYAVSHFLVPLRFPEGYRFGLFSEVNAIVGFIVGWRMIGARAGHGIGPIIGLAMTAGLAYLVIVTFLHSLYLMLVNALDGRYSHLSDGLYDIVDLALENWQRIGFGDILSSFALGCLLVALFSELLSRVAK